jgi:hypothetical protein
MTRLLAILGLACLLPLTSGCAIFGYVAAVVPGAGTKARYGGLAGQRVAVIAWAERAVTYDYPALISDAAMGTQNKIAAAADPKINVEELKGTSFVDPRQVLRWQKNHPELDNRSVAEIAPQAFAALGCTRLIYVELTPFSIYDPRTPVLLKGSATLTIRVAELDRDGHPHMGYEEEGVIAEFPEKAPEGVPPTDTMTPMYVYKGLVDKITTQAAKRFFSTAPDEE